MQVVAAKAGPAMMNCFTAHILILTHLNLEESLIALPQTILVALNAGNK
jgi:hypothetical protein